MIKKSITILLIIVLSLMVLIPLKNVYAVDCFFEIKETEISKQDNAELIINLDKISYEKFKFELISDVELSTVNTDEDIEVEKNDNEIYFEIDKQTTNLSKITFEFKIPEEKQVGDIITFVASVTNLNNETEFQTEQAQITIIEEKQEDKKEDTEKTENNQEKNEQESDTVEQEKQEPTEKLSEQERNESNSVEQEKVENQSTKANTNNVSNTQMQLAQTTKTTQSQVSNAKQEVATETVTYNGSNNNYLSNLSLDGYDFNKEFCKENNIYFVNADNISSVNIIAEKEDDIATICIYGNEDLKTGINKILINVTAENGNVRTYKIYVIVETQTSTENASILQTTSEVVSGLSENIELHATYYLSECYVQTNQEVKAGENILKYTNGKYLVAPYDCVITELNIPDDSEKCNNEHYISISSVNVLATSFKVDESKINNLSLGQSAKIKISALDEKEYKGYISNISNTASSGSFTVKVEFENDGNIRIGMTANIEI